MTSRDSSRTAAAALALALSPVWSGCYRTVATSQRIQEDVVRREVVPQGGRVDVEASRAGPAAVDVAAYEKKLCRTALHGTQTPYKELAQVKSGVPAKVFGYSALGAIGTGLFVRILVATEKPYECTEWYCADQAAERSRKEANTWAEERRFANTLVGVGAGLGVLALAAIFAPKKSTAKEYGDPQPLERFDGEPFACEGTVPAPLAGFPVLAKVAFAESKDTLDLRAVTGKDGKARLDLEPALLAAGHCGTPTLAASAAEVATLPGGAAAGPAAKLDLGAPATLRPPLGSLAEKDPAAAAVASLCCTRRAVESSGDECEERCARAGMVQKCLFNRRACLLKTERAEDEPEKARALCRSLYEECLVGNGTSSRNLAQCIDGCGAQRATEISR